jgi:uncharacterized protein
MNILEKHAQLLPKISAECQVSTAQVACVLNLLQAANTIPFIARYRKEATGDLDEVVIRSIEERFNYVVELENRRESILESINNQNKLDDDLKNKILACESKTQLEDLYLPYKPKRRTRATIAREKGLEPLAMLMLEQALGIAPEEEATKYLSLEKEVVDSKAALRGARDIVAEILAQNSQWRAFIRNIYSTQGLIKSSKRDDVSAPTKFEQYYDFSEALRHIPSHRYLAIARGERENILRMTLVAPREDIFAHAYDLFKLNKNSAFASELELAIADAFQRLVQPSVESDVCVELKIKSDKDAIDIFAHNLRTILLGAPLGSYTVLGIDPGLRTGCKCAIVESTGKFIDHALINLVGSRTDHAEAILLALVAKHKPKAIAVGNGTGGRETEAFVRKLVGKDIIVVLVNESGASVYSASEVARDEFPDLDLTIRGAISIARRLQDPLSELVKVEPKALGVGQYQHDVYQPLLEKKLHEVVESCVNQVGVELNTASAPLLSYVAGIGPNVAKNIVSFREQNGKFKTRHELKKVPGLGPKTFEQAAGFLRLRDGSNPLDASAVHPERYSVVERIAQDLGVNLKSLVGNSCYVSAIKINSYVSDELGLLTLRDIIEELKKPGRDPRAIFESPAFRDDINDISDLHAGLILEGVVTNVAAFGAFVDIGVHQDGLVHISELSEQFVRDASAVVKAGDKLKVEVLAVDIPRKRITLSARLGKRRKESSLQTPQPRAPASSSKITLGSLAGFAKLAKS